jgi:hypothetical protein
MHKVPIIHEVTQMFKLKQNSMSNESTDHIMNFVIKS